MVFPKAAALTLLSFGLATRVTAVTTCAGLVEAVGSASTVTLEGNFACSEPITIYSGGMVTVAGPYAITIDADFAVGTLSSLFVTEAGGALTLNGLTIKSGAMGGIRAVHNEGALTVVDCTFSSLSGTAETMLSTGGVIYTNSVQDVEISNSTFESNAASDKGGVVYATGTETLRISGSTFTDNKVGPGVAQDAAGGDIFAGPGVELEIVGSSFEGSEAEYGGSAVECCGATISTSTFKNTKSDMLGDHFGAILVGRRGEDECPRTLDITDSTFTGCTVDSGVGAGGSVAIFDTSATIARCTFEESQGTAVLFESSSATGTHQLTMSKNEFNSNSFPAEAFQYPGTAGQGAAVLVVNTAAQEGEGDEPVSMGEFSDMYCFANDPYECEFVYEMATIDHDGEFKCQACDQNGVQQDTVTDENEGQDEDLLGDAERDISAESSGDDDSDGTIIGLSFALGLTLLAIGALAVWKLRVRRSARRWMDDMDDTGGF